MIIIETANKERKFRKIDSHDETITRQRLEESFHTKKQYESCYACQVRLDQRLKNTENGQMSSDICQLLKTV